MIKKFQKLKLCKKTVLLLADHIIVLDILAREVQKARISNEDSERITANTFIRCLIEILIMKQKDINLSNINNEEDLMKEILLIFSR